MYNKLIFSILALTITLSMNAQQRAQFSQYYLNQYVLNPAVGGTEEYTDLKVGFRTQWVGFEGAPTTYYISANTSIGREYGPSHNHHKGEHKGWHSIGGYIYSDVTGPTSRASGLFSYGYNIPLNKNIRLSLGMFFGFQQFTIDGNRFILRDELDQVLNGVHTSMVPDGQIGAWVYSKYWYFGVAAHQILQSRLTFDDVYNISYEGVDISKLANHYFMTGGFNWPVNEYLNIVPSFMVKYVSPAPASVDLNCKFAWDKNKYFAGVSYRTLDSFNCMIGMQFNMRLIGSYSFDLTHSELVKYNTGTHEILLTYKFLQKPRGYCPSKFWH